MPAVRGSENENENMKTRKQYDTKDGTFEEIYQLEKGDAFKVVLKRVEK